MTPVIPCSASNFAFVPRNTFTIRKSKCVGRFSSLGKSIKQTSSSQKFLLHFPANLRLLPKCHTLRVHRLSATEIDVEVEAEVSPAAQEDSAGVPEEPSTSSEPKEDLTAKSDASSSPARSTRTRPPRKSDMPPVKKEDLVPGATFTGKVRSIQPFGAFVDFGAFTDGLVHVSRVSNTFVKDVASVLSVGQEVTVRVVEVNPDSGRIALSMRENDDKDSGSSDKGRPPRKTNQKKFEVKKVSKFVKGQELAGTVKNLTRSGAFIALPEGEEGFLPQSEEADDGIPNLTGSSTLEIGQEVNVRVLRIMRGQLTLTTKKEEDFQKLDSELNKGVVHLATNPFVLAFRQNKDISTFLDERENLEDTAQTLESKVHAEEATAAAESINGASSAVNQVSDSVVEDVSSVEEISEVVETEAEASIAESAGEISVGQFEDSLENDQVVGDESGDAVEQVPAVESSIEEVQTSETDIPNATSNGVVETEETSAVENDLASSSSAEEQSVTPLLEQSDPAASSSENATLPIETSSGATVSPAMVKQLRDETGAGMMDCKRALSETGGDVVKALEYLRKKGLASAEKKAGRATAEGRIGSYIHDSRIGVLVEVNCETDFVSRGDIFKELVDNLAMQVAACPQVVCLVPEDVPKETIDKERELEMQKEDLLSKPEQMRTRIVEGRIKKRLDEMALLEQPYIKNDKVLIKDWVKQTIATIGENIKVKRFVRYNLGEGLEKKSQDFAAEVAAQTAARSSPPAPPKEQPASAAAQPDKAVEGEAAPAVAVAISAALVKQLREESGAGMMDCKKALSETGGDLEKAQEYLRKKGLSAADKKSSRLAAEGRIGSYIHDSRIGVLIEVNCETDFVGRSERFKVLVDDLAMQVVACPQVRFVSMDNVPKEAVEKEKAIEMQREDILSKPENIREKIVEGRVSKRLGELVLLEQPFVKDDNILVKDLVKQTVAALGENIKVRRFTRFTLGDKTDDAATEPEAAVGA
ncbi:hypothetical protein V2J09_017856 [Rumex salicifolius]